MEDIKQYEAWDNDCHREHHCGQHPDEGTGRSCRCRERQTHRQDVRPLRRTPSEDGARHRDGSEYSRAAVSLPDQEHKAAASMAYPTTLALIAALWSGPGRTKSIALWSAIGGGIAALGPLVAGALLEQFWWGSVFLITLPLAGITLVMALVFVPSHVNETTDPVDNLGGILSVILVGTLILAINFAPVPNKGTLALGLAAIAVAAAIAFVIRQRRARNPLYDLHIAARRVFWVAACAGIIVFGSLMGSAFVSQQYLQNVNGYSTLEAGAAFLPAVIFMILVAPRSAKLVETRGARFTLLSFRGSTVGAYGNMWRSPPSCRRPPTVRYTAYGPVWLSFRTKMLAGSDPWVMAKNGKTASPLEPSPS
jgi:Major Facilitator Superfamily